MALMLTGLEVRLQRRQRVGRRRQLRLHVGDQLGFAGHVFFQRLELAVLERLELVTSGDTRLKETPKSHTHNEYLSHSIT